MSWLYRVSQITGAIFMLVASMNSLAVELTNHVKPLNKNVTENKISLNFQNIKLRFALQLLAEFSGYNFIIDDKIQSNLSLYLNNVNWEQALDTILQTQGLVKRPIAKGWFIATQNQILKQDKLNLEIQQQKQDLSPLIFRIFQVHYSKAVDISKLLKDKANTLLSSHGSVSVDKRTNSLWIRDSQAQLNKIEKTIKALDRPIEQVLIEARIVSIDQNREQELGGQFGSTPKQLANKLLTAQLKKKAATNPSVGLLQHLTMDLARIGAPSISGAATVGLRLMRLGNNSFLDLELSALENEGAAQIISTPHLITADRETAFIEAGTEIPYQEKTSSGGSNVTFKKAVLSLKVKPRIMPDRRMILDLKVNQDQPASFIAVDVPTIKARGIKTQVIIKDGETVVLGGIYEYSHSKVVRRVPFLGALPLVGYLFRLVVTNSRRSELLIFLTPTILK
jgi:type IV pilus assembly protein PilQ